MDNISNGQYIEWTIYRMDNISNGQYIEWTIYRMDNISNKQYIAVNPKDTWNLLRQLVPGKSKQTKCNFENPTRSASTLNNFFATAGEKSYNDVKQRHPTNVFDVQARHERTHSRITRKFSLWSPQPVQAADVILAISKLKNTYKSTGHDKINLQHIKESLMVTIQHITLIINRSTVTKVFPKPWKHSIIIPIHKSCDIEEPTNFRQINLLPILSKILVKVISTQLTEYLKNNNLLNESRSICLSQ